MNILKLAIEQIDKEKKLHRKDVSLLILDRMWIIRKYLDISSRNRKVAINREENKRRKNG